MDHLEIAAIVASCGGSIASALGQQVAFAVIPLSFTAAVNLANRRRLMGAIGESQQAIVTQVVVQDQRVDQLTRKHETQITTVSSQFSQQQQDLEKLSQTVEAQSTTATAKFTAIETLNKSFTEQLQALNLKDDSIEIVLEKLREIDRCTQAIRTNPKAGELYFQRGQVRQSLSRMEDNRLAIEDYTQAVALEPSMAKAYFNRGLLRSELQERRQAGEDLRLAAKSYFAQGDMENYTEAKRLSEQIYDKVDKPESFVPSAMDDDGPKSGDLRSSDQKLRVNDLFA
jgi:tetratricopeptide (TPR) repeat protein